MAQELKEDWSSHCNMDIFDFSISLDIFVEYDP